MQNTIYKVVARCEWETAEAAGVYLGSDVDHADGFIHLSAADQAIETVSKHFAGQTDLVIVSVDTALLGDTLRWEASRDGGLFPHVYGSLPISAVTKVQPLPLDDDGVHQFPAGFPQGNSD